MANYDNDLQLLRAPYDGVMINVLGHPWWAHFSRPGAAAASALPAYGWLDAVNREIGLVPPDLFQIYGTPYFDWLDHGARVRRQYVVQAFLREYSKQVLYDFNLDSPGDVVMGYSGRKAAEVCDVLEWAAVSGDDEIEPALRDIYPTVAADKIKGLADLVDDVYTAWASVGAFTFDEGGGQDGDQ